MRLLRRLRLGLKAVGKSIHHLNVETYTYIRYISSVLFVFVVILNLVNRDLIREEKPQLVMSILAPAAFFMLTVMLQGITGLAYRLVTAAEAVVCNARALVHVTCAGIRGLSSRSAGTQLLSIVFGERWVDEYLADHDEASDSTRKWLQQNGVAPKLANLVAILGATLTVVATRLSMPVHKLIAWLVQWLPR